MVNANKGRAAVIMTGPIEQSEPTQPDASQQRGDGDQLTSYSGVARQKKLKVTLGLGLGALVGAAVLVAPVAASLVGAKTVDTAAVSASVSSGGMGAGQSSAEDTGGRGGKQRGQQRGQGFESGPGGSGSASVTVAPNSLGTASESTAAQLGYLVEEEKLAHDIYVLAGSLYPDRVYVNISRSETQHQSSISALLAGYGLDDPTASTAAGEFQNPELQQLYNTLAADVRTSSEQAAEVGVLIEETDIADLKEAIAASESDAVTSTMSRLESASQNHLQAFTRLLQRS